MIVAGLVGCEKEETKPAAPPAKEGPWQLAEPVQQVDIKAKLDYSLEIKPDSSNPPKYIVKWTVTAPTGGWKLTTDSARVEEKHRELTMASIYVTLEEPKSDETVTQAVTTISGEYDAGEQPVNGAELFVRRRVKGIVPTYAESYGQMKATGKQY